MSNPKSIHQPSQPSPDEAAEPTVPFSVHSTTLDTLPTGQRQQTEAEKEEVRQDLAQIIGRARAEIKRLRQELAKLESHAAALTQERDEIQQRFQDLHDTFMDTVHVAVEDEIHQAASEMQITPERIPSLLAPIYGALTHWHETQQAEREHFLLQKLEDIEKHANILHEELLKERQALNAEREKLMQQRQELHDQIKLRETNLRTRWFAKAWMTSLAMFLVLPALQIYLLTQKAGNWSIIVIPTTICFAIIGLISFVRARKKPAPPKQASK